MWFSETVFQFDGNQKNNLSIIPGGKKSWQFDESPRA